MIGKVGGPMSSVSRKMKWLPIGELPGGSLLSLLPMKKIAYATAKHAAAPTIVIVNIVDVCLLLI